MSQLSPKERIAAEDRELKATWEADAKKAVTDMNSAKTDLEQKALQFKHLKKTNKWLPDQRLVAAKADMDKLEELTRQMRACVRIQVHTFTMA